MKRQKGNDFPPESEPVLKMKQLRSVHYLIAASCYISILESSQDNILNIREMSEKSFHGDGADILGNATQMTIPVGYYRRDFSKLVSL